MSVKIDKDNLINGIFTILKKKTDNLETSLMSTDNSIMEIKPIKNTAIGLVIVPKNVKMMEDVLVVSHCIGLAFWETVSMNVGYKKKQLHLSSIQIRVQNQIVIFRTLKKSGSIPKLFSK